MIYTMKCGKKQVPHLKNTVFCIRNPNILKEKNIFGSSHGWEIRI